MTSRTLLSPILLIIIGFSACCRAPKTYYDVPASAYTYVPDSHATFQLQDSLGQAINSFIVESHSRQYYLLENCAECCTNDYGQSYTLRFRGDNPAVSIDFILSQEGYNGSANATVLDISMPLRSVFELVLDESACGVAGALTCHDSLTVNGQQFLQVVEMVPTYNYSADSTAVNRLWYNKSRGLLKYTTLDGQVWEVMP